MADVLIDNDVVLKACCYRIDEALLAILDDAGATPRLLPLARYVVAGRIRRDRSLADPDGARAAFDRAMARLGAVEPTGEELRRAAEFEAQAQAMNLELDGGESQLLAILILRDLPLLLTGDKRAIGAIERVAGGELARPSIACLEQLMATVLRHLGVVALRGLVCAEPGVDRTMTTCFACRSPVVDPDSVAECLRSYVTHLRKAAGRVMIPSDDLSVPVA